MFDQKLSLRLVTDGCSDITTLSGAVDYGKGRVSLSGDDPRKTTKEKVGRLCPALLFLHDFCKVRPIC